MALTDDSRTPAVQMAQLVPNLIGTYSYLVGQIQQMGNRVYGGGPDAAIANVQAMGANAEAIFTVAATFESAINTVAPILGRTPINVMPAGYAFAPNADGSGVLSYVAPAPTPAAK